MSLKEIGERILADAKSEAVRIEMEARKRARLIIDQAENEARAFVAAESQRAQRGALLEKKQNLAAAGLGARDSVIAAKQEIIGEAFAGAVSIVEGWSRERYIDVLVSLITANAAGGEDVIFDNRDGDTADEVIEKANVALKKRGVDPVRRVDEQRQIGRGFILRQHQIEESFAFDMMMGAARDDLEADIADIIFGGGA